MWSSSGKARDWARVRAPMVLANRLFLGCADPRIYRFAGCRCEHRPVLAALNLGAIAVGVAAGGLAASLVGLVVAGLLSVLGVETGADIGLAVGVFAGLAAGGWLAGWRAVHSQRFHGMVTGLILAFMIMVIARLGGSPAPTWTVLWLAVVAIVVSGLFGWLAGRRRA